jgi:hypothetical protein
MATMTERLAFLISANADQAIRAFEKTANSAEKELGKAENKIDKVAGSLTKFGGGAMAFAGIAGGALFSFAKEAEDAEQQSRKLGNSIENAGTFADGAQGRMEELAKNIQKVTTADGDAVVGAEALLAQFGLTEEQIIRITPLVVDLSQKMGVDMETAAKAVAKSATGSEGALKKMGIQVSYADSEGSKFDATMEALAGTVGGFAEKEAETFSGKVDQLKISLGDLKEGIGAGVIDVFGSVVGAATGASQALADIDPKLQETAGQILAVGTGVIGVAGSFSFMAGQAMKMRDRFMDASGALTGFGKGAGIASAALVSLYAITKIFDETTSEGTATYQSLTDAITENNEALRISAIQKLAANDPNTRKYLETLNELGFTLDDLRVLYETGGGALDEWGDGLVSSFGTSESFVQQIENMNDVLGTNIDTTGMTEGQAEKLKNELFDLNGVVYTTWQAFNDNTTATNLTASALTGVGIEGNIAADALDDVTGATESLTGEWESLLGLFEREEAIQNIKDSMGEVEIAIGKAFGSGTQEDIDAAAEKVRELYGDVADYIKKVGDIPEHKQTTILAMLNAGNYAGVLKELGDLEKTRTATIDIVQGKNLVSPFFHDSGLYKLPGRAGGGSIQSNRPYMVGELGPEIIVPNSSGTVIPNNMIGAGGGSSSSNVNVTVTSSDPNEVVRALQRYVRLHGNLPKGIL